MESGVILKPGERLDDLQHDGLHLIQRADAFRFGTDSVLLADFCAPKRRDRIVDIGCGTGAIATLIAAYHETVHVDGLEIQADVADMAARSVALNGLQGRITVCNADARDAAKRLGYGAYTLAVCNPPYGKIGGALPSEGETKRLARHDATLTPEELCASAFSLLTCGGRLCVVYPAPRIFEMMRAMDRNRIAPKRIRTVHGVRDRTPKLVLLEGVKEGGDMLHWLPPLVLQEEDGSYTAEWKRIYHCEDERQL